jgi:hypothetical protein
MTGPTLVSARGNFMDTIDPSKKVVGEAGASAGEVMNTMDQSFGFLTTMDFTVPLGQIMIFAAVASLGLILGKHKLGLIAAYGFLFYWVFVLNQGFFMKQLEATSGGVYVYGALGMVMAMVGFVGFIKKTE